MEDGGCMVQGAGFRVQDLERVWQPQTLSSGLTDCSCASMVCRTDPPPPSSESLGEIISNRWIERSKYPHNTFAG